MQLDHVVVNTRYTLDQAQSCFSALGFQLTDRGYHSLGSINHLMMFEDDYLELIGLPDKPAQAGQALPTRAGVSDAPVGLNGLVFKTDSADLTYEHLKKVGMAGDPPKSFTRPVILNNENNEQQACQASFRTVHVRADCFPAGRVYFCEHHTPELVWRAEWQQHVNGAASIAEITLVAPDPLQQAEALAGLLNLNPQTVDDQQFAIGGDRFAIAIMSLPAYRQRYGLVTQDTNRAGSFFGALTIRTFDQAPVQDAAKRLGYPIQIDQPGLTGQRTLVRQPDFNTVLEFIAI